MLNDTHFTETFIEINFTLSILFREANCNFNQQIIATHIFYITMILKNSAVSVSF